MATILRAGRPEAEPRVRGLALSSEALIEVVKAAVAAANDATIDDPVNAPGTFSYIYGTRGLRQAFCVEGEWEIDRSDGVEAIFHPKKRLRIIFQNVDCAADPNRSPKPRSKKGAGSERVCEGNQLALDLPDPPDTLQPISDSDVQTLYLMVSQNVDDVRAELSRPVVKDGKFVEFLERNFLIRAGEWDAINVINDDDTDECDLPIEVTRRQADRDV